MERLETLHRFLLSMAIFACAVTVAAQVAPKQAPPQATFDPALQELSATECQGINACASWTFTKGDTGAVGIGKWPTGEEAILTVTQFDQKKGIVISRSDVSGTKRSLKATYTGTFQDGAVVGWYKSEYQGKTEYGPWYWLVNRPSNTPLTFTVWHSDGSAPVLFSFSSSSPGTRGTGTFSGGVEPIVLDSYDGTTVVVSRTETDPRWGGSAHYTGYVNGDEITGTSLVADRGGRKTVTVPWRGVFGDARGGAGYAPPPGITLAQGLQGLHDAALVVEFFSQFFGSNP